MSKTVISRLPPSGFVACRSNPSRTVAKDAEGAQSMTIDFNKPTLIAVPGVRIPASDHPLALVITLTPARAEELLRDMRHVTKLANHSSRIFKFCPFESQAAIMATADLPY